MAALHALTQAPRHAGGDGDVSGKRFLIACGGTGGHLSPGIALAEGLVACGHRVTLLISHKKVDARLVEKYPHFTFLRIPGAPFSWKPVGLARFLWQQLKGLAFGLILVRRERPHAVVGFGGFTTASIILAGFLHRVPVALHEANHVPGRAIRRLSKLARRVYLPPGVALPGLKEGKLLSLGLPVRREIVREAAASARTALDLDPKQPVLVILGGSQGATALNDWARANAAAFAADGVQTYCVTGLGKNQGEVTEYLRRDGGTAKVIFSPFCDRMGTLMSAADLVVSRAGAGTLAELARCGTPSVLIPFPHAADNHQEANARYFMEQGGGITLAQSCMDELAPAVRELIANETELRKFRDALQRLDQANALGVMIADIEQLTGGTSAAPKTASSSAPLHASAGGSTS
ncbi:UDP-N-acetylglucosamine--N-acetylmuramyl-(pentapeptide) pyrophosphoryl-undecaprenol N-acetylglucosamine transferase [Nibricoccus aquaticus]|uniref:UDP-N-acetylglucosamine--N-acetylmuramyl-(pentapeptide) pyrophosphoryl-undecaprenol N-acetylglucosamine transferase n=1 Tax=Nibricoccus aquaticus TaxID=2576891 RepID=A0A290Q858_9BACT|nr:UDP-N-acetylglucosamine--N-acetylmuramyl-(pentapeptide) pyrophosphoryl-undecaprenol N-acetylglucosamine transferase [Nibricoccus aquaticus]ATC64694.1 UDP-N-acetylglucosamine--N-acetylmuramyl-(pentapeptide) pyrophosphoryl-undecaprenol N-acetylglucosamine transferase [Nibricoccus aquaticus]